MKFFLTVGLLFTILQTVSKSARAKVTRASLSPTTGTERFASSPDDERRSSQPSICGRNGFPYAQQACQLEQMPYPN
jgi:hypothetical protein